MTCQVKPAGRGLSRPNGLQMTDRSFGQLLRFWRSLFEQSQEALALELGSSARHISRLENGLVTPSRDMADRIAAHFGLRERDTNQLLSAAGYSVVAREPDIHAPELGWLRRSLAQLLSAQGPNPTMLTSGGAWVVMANPAWLTLMGEFAPLETGAAPRVSVAAYHERLFDGAGAAGEAPRWEPTLIGVLMALKQDAILQDDPALQALVERLERHPAAPADWRRRAVEIDPMASFRAWARLGDQVHSFRQVATLVGQRGTASFVSEPRLRLITLLPENLEGWTEALAAHGAPDGHAHPLNCDRYWALDSCKRPR